MGESLTVKNETLALFHGIVDVEVLHANEIFVDVQLPQVPDGVRVVG